MVRATSNSWPFLAIAPHSNQSPLGAVSVAGKRNFEARDKGAQMAVGIHLAARRDHAPARKPADTGLFAKTGEISVRHGLRGGGCSSCQTRLRSKIPDNWEIKWEFCEKGRSQQTYDAFSAILSMCCS